MQVHWAYIDCDKDEEEQLERCWEDRQLRVHARMDALEDGPAAVQLAAAREESPPWAIQAALYLPGETVVVEHAGDDPGEAMDRVIDGLLAAADRREERPAKLTLRREGLHGIVPLLERCLRAGRSDVFFAWLAPLVGTLAAHVRRELRIRELELRLNGGEADPADILDEVLLRAHDRFERRPAKLPLDLWLLQLADEVLDEWCHPLSEASLDEPVEEPAEEPRESRRDSWIEWVTAPDTIELADLLPDVPSADRWDSLDLENKQVAMDRMLSRLPRIQRQALVLHTVHGFSTSEIADFQNRPETEVLYEINDARRALQEYFREDYLPDIEEQLKLR